ncbi:hypothetical protein [Leifsonia aquatica]|uniref:hypothetical protein n=1 Tax=Leifsonia aquatica TaxID=144185 RepID=UPI00046851AB|nr:hypothetical protein [Leifsonia aquatica]
MTTTRRPGDEGRWLTVAASLIALAALAVVIGAVLVHGRTGDWWPRAVPTTAQYQGRDYSCRGPLDRPKTATASEAAGMRPNGTTIGGGEILAADTDGTPVVIIVHADGGYTACSLSGGP